MFLLYACEHRGWRVPSEIAGVSLNDLHRQAVVGRDGYAVRVTSEECQKSCADVAGASSREREHQDLIWRHDTRCDSGCNTFAEELRLSGTRTSDDYLGHTLNGQMCLPVLRIDTGLCDGRIRQRECFAASGLVRHLSPQPQLARPPTRDKSCP